MANLNNNLKKDALAGAKLNVKESAKSAGLRLNSDEWGPYCNWLDFTNDPDNWKLTANSKKLGKVKLADGILSKTQLTELTKLGCKIKDNEISCKSVNKDAVEKILKIK